MPLTSLCSCLSRLSVCLHVCLLAPVFPHLSVVVRPYSSLFCPSSYFLSGQLSEGHRSYYLDMRYTMSALGLSRSLSLTHTLYNPPQPPPSHPCSLFLYQVIGVLISGHLCCRVTDRPVGIKWLICIIDIPALFIPLPMSVCLCVSNEHAHTHVHTCTHTCIAMLSTRYVHMSACHTSNTPDVFFSPCIFSPGWATPMGWPCSDWSHENWNWPISKKMSVVCISREARRTLENVFTPLAYFFSLFTVERTHWWQLCGLSVCLECWASKV